MTGSIRRASLIVILATAAWGVSPAPWVHQTLAAQSPDDAAMAKRFVGMWRLVAWNQRLADGTVRPAQADQGYLVYADVGRMCAVIMDSRRPKWDPQPPATVPEAMARFAGLVSYCASVEVNAREGYVVHRVDVERNPGAVGIIRKRWFTFDGPDRLTLRIDRQELQGSVVDSTLVWERVQK